MAKKKAPNISKLIRELHAANPDWTNKQIADAVFDKYEKKVSTTYVSGRLSVARKTVGPISQGRPRISVKLDSDSVITTRGLELAKALVDECGDEKTAKEAIDFYNDLSGMFQKE